MAKILALDTSTAACSVALVLDDAADERFIVAPQDHTQRLLPMVDELLSAHGLKLKNLDAIAFGAGPGSFTGLRICLGVVQGLAFGANLLVVPVSSLAAIAASAYRLLDIDEQTAVVPAFDARMNEVYWGWYDKKGGSLEALSADSVSSPAAIAASFPEANVQEPLIGVGDGWLCSGMPVELLSRTETDFYPHAFDIALLAGPLFAAGKAIAALDANPVYIRNEVSWKKRQKLRP